MDTKLQKIFERRNQKEGAKSKLISERQTEHKMLVEVHSLRRENAQANINKEKERMKKY
jgi:hypothetical protein